MSTSPSDTPTTPVADLSYEQARDELVRLVARIESGQVPLEESMVLWERGEELAAHCQAKLDAAQDTLDRATGQGVGVDDAPADPAGAQVNTASASASAPDAAADAAADSPTDADDRASSDDSSADPDD